MKFIVDAQLPKTLSDYLNEQGHDSIHTLELPRANQTSDEYINQLSLKEERIVIIKDTDFLESFIVKNIPRKLILIKTGNIANRQLFELLRKNLSAIEEMMQRGNLIEVRKDAIVVHE